MKPAIAVGKGIAQIKNRTRTPERMQSMSRVRKWTMIEKTRVLHPCERKQDFDKLIDDYYGKKEVDLYVRNFPFLFSFARIPDTPNPKSIIIIIHAIRTLHLFGDWSLGISTPFLPAGRRMVYAGVCISLNVGTIYLRKSVYGTACKNKNGGALECSWFDGMDSKHTRRLVRKQSAEK